MDNSLRGQTADLVVVDEAQESQADIDMSAMFLPVNTNKSVTRDEMFSLNRYLVKKAQARLAQATARQAKRDAKTPQQ